MTNVFECGGFTFLSNFDSGNLARVELVSTKQTDTTSNLSTNVKNCPVDEEVDFEFNIWTRPDCSGTEFENCNRTWFYFGIRGGAPFALIKLNIVNLNKQSKMYSQGMAPVFRIVPGRNQWDRVKDKPTYTAEENNFTLSFKYRTLENLRATTYFAFTYPFSYTDLQLMLSNIDTRFSELSTTAQADDIYYHRECACYSSEGLRVDLITVSSNHGISSEREIRLKHLFPEQDVPRPFNFPGKKVIFLSARVHPGETPSSFVLNGFLNFLLNHEDPQAVLLRKTYVFKLIPMLNPDGVSRGHYRTDMQGVNLNRVYLRPSLSLHPSVFAARALLKLYHHGRECDDEIKTTDPDTVILDCETDDCQIIDEAIKSPSNNIILDDTVLNKVTNIESQVSGLTLDEKDETQILCIEKEKTIFSDIRESILKAVEVSDKLHYQTCTETISVVGEGLPVTKFMLEPESRSETKSEPMDEVDKKPAVLPTRKITNSADLDTKGCEPGSETSGISDGNNIVTKPEDSGLFLYLDMHGHASKKGIFMYGNHFENIDDSIECMLLPKIMALNSQNFHFTACNFTERNMYLRDRRDGMSREGSGRVAVLKATGLVRSYTLECNYNTGRLVNILPPCVRESGKQPLALLVPPKFTPAVFEEIGRALGVSILDLTGSNPWSRIPNSAFRTLSGIRDWLRLNCVPEQLYLRKQQQQQKRSQLGPSQVASTSSSSVSKSHLYSARNRRLAPLLTVETKTAEVPPPNSDRKENLGSIPFACSHQASTTCAEPKENIGSSFRHRNPSKKLKNVSGPNSGVLKQVLAVRAKSAMVGALVSSVKNKSASKVMQRMPNNSNVGSLKSAANRLSKFRKTTTVVSLALCAFPDTTIKVNQLVTERKGMRLPGQRKTNNELILSKGHKRMKIATAKIDQATCSYLLKAEGDVSEGGMDQELPNYQTENVDDSPGCSFAGVLNSNQELNALSGPSPHMGCHINKSKIIQSKTIAQCSTGKSIAPLAKTRVSEGLAGNLLSKCGTKLDKQSKNRVLHVHPVKCLHKSPSFSKRKSSELVKKRGKVTLKSLATSVGKLKIPNSSEPLQPGLEKKRKKPVLPKCI